MGLVNLNFILSYRLVSLLFQAKGVTRISSGDLLTACVVRWGVCSSETSELGCHDTRYFPAFFFLERLYFEWNLSISVVVPLAWPLFLFDLQWLFLNLGCSLTHGFLLKSTWLDILTAFSRNFGHYFWVVEVTSLSATLWTILALPPRALFRLSICSKVIFHTRWSMDINADRLPSITIHIIIHIFKI